MSSTTIGRSWRAIGVSVRGAAHVRAELPNQDAFCWLPSAGEGLPLCLAVADGHGSGKCFRSDIGAGFATEVAVAVLQEFLTSDLGDNLSMAKRTAEERLPHDIVRRWRSRVDEHLQSSPFSPAEWDALERQEGSQTRAVLESRPRIAYGATLLSVGVTAAFIVYLQLGDGDILIVPEEGETFRALPADARLFANETTSLCSPEAGGDFRCAFRVHGDRPPALLVVSTDGYANCFASETDFLQVGADLLKAVRETGFGVVQDSLRAQLQVASQLYSGDDITLAVLCPAETGRSDLDADSSAEDCTHGFAAR